MSITEQNTISVGEPGEIAVAAKPRRRNKGESKERALEAPAAATPVTKAELVLKKLRAPRGVTVQGLMEATGWQAPFGARLFVGHCAQEARPQRAERDRQGWRTPLPHLCSSLTRGAHHGHLKAGS